MDEEIKKKIKRLREQYGIPTAKKGVPLFRPGVDEPCVATVYPSNDIRAFGFKIAANKLVDIAVKEPGCADYLVYSVGYLYRMYIVSRLKAISESAKQISRTGHNLEKLWKEAKPTATAYSNSPVCEGATIELYSGPDGMTTYSWTGPGGWTSGTQNASRTGATLAMAGPYTLTVTNGNGCSDNDTTNVIVNFAILESVLTLVGNLLATLAPTLGLPAWLDDVVLPIAPWTGGPLSWTVDMLGWGLNLVGTILEPLATTLGLPDWLDDLVNSMVCALFTPFTCNVTASAFAPCG